MQDDWEFCNCDLVANSQLCDHQLIRSRVLFGRFDLTCHFREGARLLRAGLPAQPAAKSRHRAALFLRTSAA